MATKSERTVLDPILRYGIRIKIVGTHVVLPEVGRRSGEIIGLEVYFISEGSSAS